MIKNMQVMKTNPTNPTNPANPAGSDRKTIYIKPTKDGSD
jgi:hypothetical protein